MLDVTTGLRRSELFALNWLDVDFSNLTIDVQRSIYLGQIGNCKTEASRKQVPLDERVAADLWPWKESCKISEPQRLDICQPPRRRETTVLARHRVAKDDPPSSNSRWNPQKDRVAYVSAHLLNPTDRKWRERKGRPGTHAPCQQPVYTRGLYAGTYRSQAARATAVGAGNSLRRARCIGTRDPRRFRCLGGMIAAAHGAIRVDGLLRSHNDLRHIAEQLERSGATQNTNMSSK